MTAADDMSAGERVTAGEEQDEVTAEGSRGDGATITADVDVVVTEGVWGEPLAELAGRRRVLRRPGAWRDHGEVSAAASGARALIVRNRTVVDGSLLAACPRLRIVARAGVGLDNIDLAAADRAGVVVTAPLGANAVSVAEHAVGLALALARRTVPLDAACRAGRWTRTAGRELAGGTWGLLGAGATARACGRLAAALRMRVIGYDPYVNPADRELTAAGITLAPLADVVSGCDVLSCHLPATAETRGLVDAALLARMRPGALLVNVGRGDVVDEEALADALESGALGGAALDVRRREPPPVGRLEKLDTVILTPHIAGITAQSQHRILRMLADDIDAVLDGRPAASAVGAHRQVSP